MKKDLILRLLHVKNAPAGKVGHTIVPGSEKGFGWKHYPQRDWQIAFAVFVLLSLGLAVWSRFFYLSVSGGEAFLIDKSVTSVSAPINVSGLSSVVDTFSQRAAQFRGIQAGGAQ